MMTMIHHQLWFAAPLHACIDTHVLHTIGPELSAIFTVWPLPPACLPAKHVESKRNKNVFRNVHQPVASSNATHECIELVHVALHGDLHTANILNAHTCFKVWFVFGFGGMNQTHTNAPPRQGT